jgi:hypothetical protein
MIDYSFWRELKIKTDQQKIANLTFQILKSRNKLNVIAKEHINLRYFIDCKHYNYLMRVKGEISDEAWVEITSVCCRLL